MTWIFCSILSLICLLLYLISYPLQWLAGILGVLLFFWYKAVNSLAGQFEGAMEAGGEEA